MYKILDYLENMLTAYNMQSVTSNAVANRLKKVNLQWTDIFDANTILTKLYQYNYLYAFDGMIYGYASRFYDNGNQFSLGSGSVISHHKLVLADVSDTIRLRVACDCVTIRDICTLDLVGNGDVQTYLAGGDSMSQVRSATGLFGLQFILPVDLLPQATRNNYGI